VPDAPTVKRERADCLHVRRAAGRADVALACHQVVTLPKNSARYSRTRPVSHPLLSALSCFGDMPDPTLLQVWPCQPELAPGRRGGFQSTSQQGRRLVTVPRVWRDGFNGYPRRVCGAVSARLTRSARTAVGVCQPRVLRGRALSSAATSARCSTLCTDRSLPFGTKIMKLRG